jgi:colanic acid/amylovoran biosynthesis protein
MLRLFPYVDLAYAREPVSYANMREILPDAPNIREAPDFTCLCEPAPPSLRLKEKSYVALVPNMRMVDRTAPEVSKGYMSFCTSLVRAVLDHGESVVLVNHEGRDDETLCHEINARFGNSLTILSGLSGVECKAALARAKLVVSSRFHGVVSGLVEGVPTLCTSWSHKYGELLKEHGRPGSALDVRDPAKAVATVIDALERPADYVSAPGCIEAVRRRTQEMWDEIFSTLPPEAFSAAQPKYRLW